MAGDMEHWDAFVSHAWEDKDTFVRPLVEALGLLGVSLWYDEVSLRLGDSLSGSIDRGIASRVTDRGGEPRLSYKRNGLKPNYTRS